MRRDRILLAVDGMQVGGTERQLVALLNGLRQSQRFDVVLAVLDRGGALENDARGAAAAVLPLRRRARFDCSPAVSLLWGAHRTGIRLIHAVGWMSTLASLPAARVLGIPLVSASFQAAPSQLRLRDRISRWCAAQSDWIIANSRAALQAHGLSDHPRAQVIPNGIDVPQLERATVAATESPSICMVANFSVRKDHASVIRALSIVRRTVPDAQLFLVGGDQGTLAANRHLAEELGVSEAVHFVTDTMRPEPYIAGSQVCVLASPSESFPNAILEYLALGRPVVATETCGDAAPLLRDSDSGLLVPLHSPHALAECIVALLRDPQRAQRMGEAGRQWVQTLTVPRMVAAYEALYARLLTPPMAAAGRR